MLSSRQATVEVTGGNSWQIYISKPRDVGAVQPISHPILGIARAMVDTVTQRSAGPCNCHDQSTTLHLERILHANQITVVLSLRSRICTWRRRSKEKTTITSLSPRPSTCLVHRSSVPPSTLVHLLHIHTLPRLPAQ